MREVIALRRNQVCVESVDVFTMNKQNEALVMSVQANLMSLGYMLSEKAMKALSNSSEKSIVKFHDETTKHIRRLIGGDIKFNPFYKNFPSDVMEMSYVELYFNAICHYYSSGKWVPAQEIKERGFAFEKVKFTVLEPVSGDEWIRELANELATFPKPLDEQSIKDLIWIAHNVPNVEVGKITVKETLCELAASGIDVKVTNPTDVLRIALKLSGGDISLTSIPKTAKKNRRVSNVEVKALRDKHKFMKFNRIQRRFLLNILEGIKNLSASDMQTHLGRWLRLGEILHPGEYANSYPKAAAAFAAIRNQKEQKVRTFAGSVEIAFANDMIEGFNVLKQRPGEFARRLDYLVRTYGDTAIDHFEEVIDKVSSKVIFEMYDHFEARLFKKEARAVMIKGTSNVQKLKELVPLSKMTVKRIQDMIFSSMEKRMAALPKMGKVFIDESLKCTPIPFSMQSSSGGKKIAPRGSRFKLDDASTIRGYVHWNAGNKTIDIDLAAGFLDSKFNMIGEISFYSLTNSAIKAYHSGDVRHVYGPCAEYIDFSKQSALNTGARYVLFNVYNYDGGPLSLINECTFGFMSRSKPESNEIFDPKTVVNSFSMIADSNSVCPVMIDLQTNEAIWIDASHNTRGIPVQCKGENFFNTIKSFIDMTSIKASIYDLIEMHVRARGGEIVDEAEAEVKYDSEYFSDYTKLASLMAI
jgi:hypothetical protein